MRMKKKPNKTDRNRNKSMKCGKMAEVLIFAPVFLSEGNT